MKFHNSQSPSLYMPRRISGVQSLQMSPDSVVAHILPNQDRQLPAKIPNQSIDQLRVNSIQYTA